MALTADQTAVLELLLAGQSYSDLSEMLGIEEDEVRGRARAALAELAGADPDHNVGLSDYLLGQADPIGRADAVRHLRQDRGDYELAAVVAERLAELAPGAALPKLPPPPAGGTFLGRGSAPAAAPSPREGRSPLAAVPRNRGRLYAALGGAAVILIAVVLAVSGVFSGDDSEPEQPPAATTETSDDPTAGIGEIPAGEELSRIPLTPTGGGNAAGAAIVGLSTGDQPYIDLLIENLETAPQGQAYVVWFMFDKNTGYPLSPIFPEKGSFTDRFAIPSAVVGLIFNERVGAQSIEVALSDARQTLEEIQIAARDETFQIQRPGRTILEGKIPSLEDAAGAQSEG